MSTAVIILAAGAGTRMKSKKQKTLHEIGGRSLLSHSIHAAAQLSPDEIVTVIGHGRDQVGPAVEEIAQQLDTPILTAIQTEQHGTGHAVKCGLKDLPGFDGTVIVTNADVPLLRPETLQALYKAHTEVPTGVTVLTMDAEDPTGYGRIIRNADGQVAAIVEEKDATDEQKTITEVNSGVFAFDATVLKDALDKLDTNNAQGEMYLTDVLAHAREAGHGVRAHIALDPGELNGVNDRVQLAAAGKELNRRVVEQAMRDGATVLDPESTWIDVTVTIGQDCTILPNTQLLGTTSIGQDATVGPDTTLDNVTVGHAATVMRTQGIDSTVGDYAMVGPFAYLRPGTHLGESGKIGGFVETKNASIGTGAKVPHLSYVGDATIGDYSNIGASSVFVNYDGVNKHRTTVGSHVRTGSDTMFIAPVNVGDGAYSGAGTVIRHDVPAGALTVNDMHQKIIPGWVEEHRPNTDAARAAQESQDTSE